jgi:hypothetical protein
MSQYHYGYYIHGKAPWGDSDLPIAWLKRELDNERNGAQKSRQFSEMAQTHERNALGARKVITTYEIYITKQMRDDYESLFQTQGGA